MAPGAPPSALHLLTSPPPAPSAPGPPSPPAPAPAAAAPPVSSSLRFISIFLLLLLLLLCSTAGDAAALEVVDQAAPLTCSQGLANCSVTEVSFYSLPLGSQERTVDVEQVDLHVVLCCSQRQDCQPCLQILITFQGVELEQQQPQEGVWWGEEEDSAHSLEERSEANNDDRSVIERLPEGSGKSGLSDPTALVRVCVSSSGISYCKSVEFQPDPRFQKHGSEHKKLWLMLREEVRFGSLLVVKVHSRATTVYNLTVLSLHKVCYLNLDATVKDCQAPRLEVVANQARDEVVLHLDTSDAGGGKTAMFQKFWNEMPGEVMEWPKGQREITISTNAVAPCLCFQVWWKGKPMRRESCPFKNLQGIMERMQHKVSVSLSEAPVRGNHGNARQATALHWNVSSPCRLEGEVWLCKQDSAGGSCDEVAGSRQRLYNHTLAGWRATANGQWKKGEFVNMSSHPTLCVQVKLHGSHSNPEPHCPFAEPRWRCSLLIFVGILLVCVSILGAYFVQGLLKGYAWRWFKESDVKGMVAGSHVVLLHQSDGGGGEQAMPVLLSRLGASLQSLGFSVALDLWSQTELAVLGPVPWLHSQLDRIQRQGGKVVLVLSRSAWSRADEWAGQGWERGGSKGRESRAGGECDEEGEDGKAGMVPASSNHMDAFSASLSCVLADYMQGRAGERFVLVQFESLPLQVPGSNRPLPELFRGLYLHCLPSQSLAFLTDLAGARPGTGAASAASAAARRKKAGKLRVASRVLARGLTGAGVTILRLAGLPQDCVGVVEEDTWETVPLQQSNDTTATSPPSSPDTCPKEAGLEWV